MAETGSGTLKIGGMMSNGTTQAIQTPYDVPMGTPYVATLFRTYINN